MFNVDIEYGHENSVDSLMCLKYISFNNFFKVMNTDDSTYFRVVESYMDIQSFTKPTVIIRFNNKIDPVSAVRKENYEIIVGKKAVRFTNVQVSGKTLFIRLKEDDIKNSLDSIRVTFHNIKDTDGNILNKRKLIELTQYRELFVQEYNKSLPFADSCFLQYLPLEQNCISKYPGTYKYWMNTPENIKKIK
jgi:hypothetical protein